MLRIVCREVIVFKSRFVTISKSIFPLFFSGSFRYRPTVFFSTVGRAEIFKSQAADDNSFLVRWNERVVIMHSYVEFIEMKRAKSE